MATDEFIRFVLLLNLVLLVLAQLQLLYGQNCRAADDHVENNINNNASVNCGCIDGDGTVKRDSFPDGFVFGASGSAYQYEGAYNKDGKGLSNWDYYTHAHPERIADGTNGDVGVNSYMLYKEDVRMAKEMGLDAYRFSISWSRILPHGRLFGGQVNEKGLEYYDNLIDELLLNDIKPYVTLFHWDVPLTLEKHYGGFLSRRIVGDFRYYVDVCFEHFGNRVKNWITLNEPWSFSDQGYSIGTLAPGRCSDHASCLGGNSGIEPYLVAHHQLLAHGVAVKLYKQKYQTLQNGSIGISHASRWYLPCSNSTSDLLAQERAMEFELGWFMDPLIFGTYPKSMKALVGSRLPTFTASESKMIKGSFDFIGINYYTSYYVKDARRNNSEGPFSYTTDSQVTYASARDGVPIGKQADIDWLYIYPKGIRGLMNYIRRKYNNPPIFITENDVRMAKEMGLDAYRFSISWSRILPHGRLFGGQVNEKGLEYYDNLIDELLLNDIKPYVTLFHWDVPLTLEKHYGGFLSRRIVGDFRYYVDVCFEHFGNRVKNWITLNEPWSFSDQGYSIGTLAPGRCSDHASCLGGNSGIEPYLVAHHQLLAHGVAVKLYKQKYQTLQNGSIGISHASRWYLPCSNSTSDLLAQERAMEFELGWFMDPLIFGTYPKSMKALVGSRLPTFTASESKMIKGSFDFIGINYYTSYYVKDARRNNSEGPFSYTTDSQVTYASARDGVPIGKQADIDWLYIYPKGIRGLMNYIRRKYNNPPIFITENGVCETNNPTIELEEALNDKMRVDYIHDHLCCLLNAIKDGSQVKGYFAWSLLDNYEWSSGYTVRFGLNYVDYKNNLSRYPKHSAIWLKSILGHGLENIYKEYWQEKSNSSICSM